MSFFPRGPFVLLLALFSVETGRLLAQAAPEQALADLKVYAANGAPWRIPSEDWAGARQRVASDPEWGKWLQREQTAVDDWIAKRHDRVTWVCGWFHDFVSPKDGSHLTFSPEVPGEEVKFLTSPSDPHVDVTPKIMAAWVYAFRTEHAGMIQRAARLYKLTGDEKYSAWASSQLDFYAEHYLEWLPQRKDQGARLYWQTLDEATNGAKYIDVVRLLTDAVDPARKQKWWDQFFKPEAEVLNRGFQSIHNIATWHRCAVAQFALIYHDDALWHEAIDGTYGLRNQIAKGITADYLWWEQSYHYNEYVVDALLTLFTQAGLAGRANELTREMAIAENLMLSPIYVRFPTGLLPNPADGTGIERVPHRSFLAGAVRVFPTTLGLTEAARGHNWNSLVDPPGASPRPDTLPAVVSQNMEASRMAVIKQGPWQVFFHYGQLTASHAQSEALNFSVSYGETDISHDPGTVGYGSPYHKNYYTRGLNHNVPLINGEGEVAPQPGQLLEYSSAHARLSASQPKYRPDADARRTLVIEGDRLIDTATLRSHSDTPQALGLALHLQGKVRLTEDFKPAETFAAGRPASFGYWKNVTTATFQDHATFEVDFGAVVLSVTLAVPGEFTLWHGSTPDVPPKRREGFYLETHGKEATFTTTFAPVTGDVKRRE